jgi:hypothetical protein
MHDEAREPQDDSAEELLRRALLDSQASVAVGMRVAPLSVAEALTIVFHGRADLGTIQTYVANGGHGAGEAVAAGQLLRVPCDLDLADAEDRDDAEALYAQQAGALRDALLAADTVLAVWREPLADLIESTVDVARSVEIDVVLPAPRLMPIALVAPERQLMVVPVCGARTLAEGRPPLGIACAQQDVARVYPLPDDPERCLTDFLGFAAEHARRLGEQLEHQEASVRRFLELTGDDELL